MTAGGKTHRREVAPGYGRRVQLAGRFYVQRSDFEDGHAASISTASQSALFRYPSMKAKFNLLCHKSFIEGRHYSTCTVTCPGWRQPVFPHVRLKGRLWVA